MTDAAVTIEYPRKTRLLHFAVRNAATISMAIVVLLLIVAFAIGNDAFLTVLNLRNLARQMAPALIVAVAMAFVITSGQIDLSVGSLLALAAAGAAELLRLGVNEFAVLLAVLIGGAIVGGLQGYVSAYQGVPSFIVTLAGLSIIRGFALLITEGFSIPIKSGLFETLGRTTVFGLAVPAWIAIGTVLLGVLVMNFTPIGQYINGIGSNEEAVRRSGVNTRAIKLGVMAGSGMAAAAAGILVAGRLGSGSANSGVAFELAVISAVVLGGTDLFGGRGTVIGTLIGVMLIAIVGNGLILMGVSPFWTPIVSGILLLAAVWANLRVFSRLPRLARYR
ncbi:MAG: ABC transporter permease [Actinobacteria bacterium]|nr:ABC transporter permease [Actinomycetota bacterium]